MRHLGRDQSQAERPVTDNFLPAALQRVLSFVAFNELTGYLVATRGRMRKRLALESGELVFAASNDPRDRIGHALLRSGLIAEGDLVEGLQSVTGAPQLAAALSAMRKVTPGEWAAVFEANIRESVLDIFLWPSGLVQFTRSSLGEDDAPFPLRLPLGPLLVEGRRRRSRWTIVGEVLHDPNAAFDRQCAWPSGFPATTGDQWLASLVDSGRTLGEILLEMHGQDYAVKVRLANLVERKVLAVRDASLFAAPAPRCEEVVPGGGTVSEVPRGEFTNIARLPQEKGHAPPAHLAEGIEGELGELLAHTALKEAEERFLAAAEAKGLLDKTVLALAIPQSLLAGRSLSPAESFLISRFASGPRAVSAVKAVCPLLPHEVLTSLQGLIDKGMLRHHS